MGNKKISSFPELILTRAAAKRSMSNSHMFISILLFLITLVFGCSKEVKNYSVDDLKIKVIVKQNFKYLTKKQGYKEINGIKLPIEDVVTQLLDKSGCVEITNADCDERRLTLLILVNAEAISGSYMVGDFWSGARVWGSIHLLDTVLCDTDNFFPYEQFNNEDSFEIFDQKNDSLSCLFGGYFKPQRQINTKFYRSPVDAPFKYAFDESSFKLILGQIIRTRFGDDVAAEYWKSLVENIDDLKKEYFNEIAELNKSRAAEVFTSYIYIFHYRLPAGRDNFSYYTYMDLLNAFETVGDSSANELIEILKSTNPKNSADVKACAAHITGRLKFIQAEEVLFPLSTTDQPRLKVWTSFALYKFGHKQYLDSLIVQLDSSGYGYDDAAKFAKFALQEIIEDDFDVMKYLILKSEQNQVLFNALPDLPEWKHWGKDTDEWLAWWKTENALRLKRDNVR